MFHIYLDSTIPSYLAARPSDILVRRARQDVTWKWWTTPDPNSRIYVSEATILEISEGNPTVAARRLELCKELPVLAITTEIESIADQYIALLGLAPRSRPDALHIACATVYAMDVLLTWNSTHMANPHNFPKIRAYNLSHGLPTIDIITPDQLVPEPAEE